MRQTVSILMESLEIQQRGMPKSFIRSLSAKNRMNVLALAMHMLLTSGCSFASPDAMVNHELKDLHLAAVATR